jgi:hypothetical protein
MKHVHVQFLPQDCILTREKRFPSGKLMLRSLLTFSCCLQEDRSEIVLVVDKYLAVWVWEFMSLRLLRARIVQNSQALNSCCHANDNRDTSKIVSNVPTIKCLLRNGMVWYGMVWYGELRISCDISHAEWNHSKSDYNSESWNLLYNGMADN